MAMLSALLNGCAPAISPSYAPVVSKHQQENAKDEAPYQNQTKHHQVKKGETLYAISLLYDLDYRQLAQWNQIAPPYKIEIGQKIRLYDTNPDHKLVSIANAPKMEKQHRERLPRPNLEAQTTESPDAITTHGIVAKVQQNIATANNKNNSAQKPAISLNNLTDKPPNKPPPLKITSEKIRSSSQKKSAISIDNENMLKLNFRWPIKGKVLKPYSKTTNKGIDIAGVIGQDVNAAEAGKVVYSGQSLIGYGQLLIIKHNDEYLSAYANNSQLLVAEGYTVDKGQVIAKVGQAGSKPAKSNQASLHFEIRKNGKPVNPLNFLPAH